MSALGREVGSSSAEGAGFTPFKRVAKITVPGLLILQK
jgi:hypothetical protein